MVYGSNQLQPSRRKAAPRLKAAARRGFTLIEIMIVVVILGILAAIVVPQMSGASEAARENTLKDITRYLRSAIVTYRAQHLDVPPGYPGGSTAATPTEAAFIAQMTLYTDESGNTNATFTNVYKYGPYLSKMPSNPMSNLSTVSVLGTGTAIPAPDNTTGWYYKPDTQEILPNSTGSDTAGTAFSSY
jgi:prepilin-type N-terminal cleavage/methylation domain-containing protein